MKIGFFDSGLGGLMILKAVAKHLPEYDYEYYGDTANLPYGEKGEEEVFELTKQGVEELFRRDCALVIVACNTSSAESLRKLQLEYASRTKSPGKVLGVIIPTIEAVCEAGLSKVILIGTKRTIESKKYEIELAKTGYQGKLITIATPTLVPLIEDKNIKAATSEVLDLINQHKDADGLILGCTHYAILKDGIREGVGQARLQIISQDEIIPERLRDYLERHQEIETLLSKNSKRNIYLTKHSDRYDHLLQELLVGSFVVRE